MSVVTSNKVILKALAMKGFTVDAERAKYTKDVFLLDIGSDVRLVASLRGGGNKLSVWTERKGNDGAIYFPITDPEESLNICIDIPLNNENFAKDLLVVTVRHFLDVSNEV